jgi:hypothetical protein
MGSLSLPLVFGANWAYRHLRQSGLSHDLDPPYFPNLGVNVNHRLRIGHRSGWICSICNKPCNMQNGTIDHHIPLSRGGSDAFENLRWAHLICNQQKADSLPESGAVAACYRSDVLLVPASSTQMKFSVAASQQPASQHL